MNNGKIEQRTITAEMRATGDGKKLIGHAAVFNSLSENLGGFREKIAPGAFARSIREGADVRALLNHNADFVLGRTKSGTLKLREDSTGLHVEINLPSTEWAAHVRESVRRGDLDQMSFGFRVRPNGDRWEKQGDENIRTLLDVDLLDVSVVAFPAYPQTTIQARSRGTNMNAELKVLYEEKRKIDADQRKLMEAGQDNTEQYENLSRAFSDISEKIRVATEREERQRELDLRAYDDMKLQNDPIKPQPSKVGQRERRVEPARDVELTRFLKGEIRALQADKDVSGGFAVPTQFAKELVEEKKRRTIVRQLCRTIILNSGDGLRFPKLSSRPAAPVWTSELSIGNADTATDLQAVQFSLHPHRTYIRVSRDLIDSAQIDIAAMVRDQFAYQFATSEEQAFISGSGSGQPLGFMVASDSGVSTSRDVSESNSTTQITADGLINCYYALEPQYQQNSTWVFHPDALKMVRKLKTGSGDFLWRMGLSADRPDTILDRPVATSMFMPSTFTSGLYVGVLADFQAGYWICEFNQFMIQVLVELFAASNEVGYVGKSRLDAQPVDELAFARVKLG